MSLMHKLELTHDELMQLAYWADVISYGDLAGGDPPLASCHCGDDPKHMCSCASSAVLSGRIADVIEGLIPKLKAALGQTVGVSVTVSKEDLWNTIKEASKQ